MDKIKLRASALLLCIFLMCLCVVPASAAEGNGGLFGLPREAESMVGDVTGAVNDAIGEMTGNTDNGEGGNIPQDSAGSITDTDPVTDPVTTAPTTTDNRTTANTTGTGNGSGTGSDTGNTAENDGASGFVGIVIAIIAAIAVVLLIIALMPRKKNG